MCGRVKCRAWNDNNEYVWLMSVYVARVSDYWSSCCLLCWLTTCRVTKADQGSCHGVHVSCWDKKKEDILRMLYLLGVHVRENIHRFIYVCVLYKCACMCVCVCVCVCVRSTHTHTICTCMCVHTYVHLCWWSPTKDNTHNITIRETRLSVKGVDCTVASCIRTYILYIAATNLSLSPP